VSPETLVELCVRLGASLLDLEEPPNELRGGSGDWRERRSRSGRLRLLVRVAVFSVFAVFEERRGWTSEGSGCEIAERCAPSEDASEIAARGNGTEETSERARGKTHAGTVTQSSASLAVVSTAVIAPRPREWRTKRLGCRVVFYVY
jgi:hypothetical protein